MIKIYSKIEKTKLLHVIVKKDDLLSGREEIIPENNFIQCAKLKMNSGKTFKPHRHIWKTKFLDMIAQESWIIIQGKVKCIFYDLDDNFIYEHDLYPGDASFTLEGGHNYIVMDDDTIVYEYKTGPYEGQILDKKFI